MKIKDIKAKPLKNYDTMGDYRVDMAKVLELPAIKTWLKQREAFMEYYTEELLKEGGALVRVRHTDGEIYEMMVHQAGSREHLCCMFYQEPEDFEVLKRLIEAGGGSNAKSRKGMSNMQ